MEYYQGGGGAVIRLDWSSPSQARETIPQSCLWSVSQPTYTISGKVTDLAGTPISGASVYISDTATGSPLLILLTDSSGNYSQTMTNGTWYVSVGCAGYLPSASEPVIVNGAAVGNVNFAFGAASAIDRDIPRTNDLMFGCVTESFPATGPTGPWAAMFPAGLTLSTIGSPTVETLGGIKWERNNYSDGDGYLQARYAAPIAVNGVTIIAAVRPIYAGVGGEPRGEIVDIFYDRLALAISHNDGRVMVARNYWNDWGPAIPEGQNTILSLVVQTDGSYKVWANGAQIITGGANGTWTSINPDHTATWGSDPDFTHYVTVGRNAPDGWSTYNGYLGDVFLYKVALTDGERIQVENDIANKLAGSGGTYTITASAGPEVRSPRTAMSLCSPGSTRRSTSLPARDIQ